MTARFLLDFLKWLASKHQIILMQDQKPLTEDQLRTLINRFNRRPAVTYHQETST